MGADGDSFDGAGRPDPTELKTAAEFVDALRRLKLWTGWGYRRLEKRAVAAGDTLPRSTLTFALSRATLPREDLVAAFTRACGCDEDQIARWVAARRRIAGAADPAARPAIAAGARRRPRATRLIRAAVILVVLAAAATTTGILLRHGNPTTPGPGVGPGQAAPGQPDQDRFRPDSPTPGTSVPPTSTTPRESARPTAPTTTTIDPILPITLPEPGSPDTGLPVPGIPTLPTITVPPPTAAPTPPQREARQLPDGRTVYCPLPYLVTHFGPLGQCTLPSGNQAAVVHYSPVVGNVSVRRDKLEIVEPTWYEGTTVATDGIVATARGYAIVKTDYGPGIWATQYRDGEGRIGIVNPITHRFYPDTGPWLPVT